MQFPACRVTTEDFKFLRELAKDIGQILKLDGDEGHSMSVQTVQRIKKSKKLCLLVCMFAQAADLARQSPSCRTSEAW